MSKADSVIKYRILASRQRRRKKNLKSVLFGAMILFDDQVHDNQYMT